TRFSRDWSSDVCSSDLFETWAGLTQSDDNKVYLRPETAQGVFVQFENVVDTNRIRVPFGIGNVGKSFRNEITPRNFTYRSREFRSEERRVGKQVGSRGA